jgi:hypothetical protein
VLIRFEGNRAGKGWEGAGIDFRRVRLEKEGLWLAGAPLALDG